MKPLDDALVAELAASHELLVTVEENVIMGGAGAAVAESLAKQGLHPQILMLGLPDHFIDQGEPADLLREAGLDAEGIVRAVLSAKVEVSSRPYAVVYESSRGN